MLFCFAGFYPLAFAVVDSETEDNWTWFLNHLSGILVLMGQVVTFFSDRNQGLLKSMAIVFPSWPHSYCYFHLKQNLISKYPKSGFGKVLQEKVLKLFARCAFVVTESEFQEAMDELLVVGSAKVKSFIADLSKEHYANAYFDGKRYGETANSLAESFNNWIGELRQLPVLPLIDGLRKKLMVMNSNRSIESEKWTTILCPVMEKDLKNKVEVGRTWNVIRSSSKIFEVCGDVSVMVDCESRTCSCCLWQINGFPCTHAVAAILGNRESVYDYVECYFKSEFFRKAYESPVFPIPDIGKGLGNKGSISSVILPPITKRPAGRPPTKRIKSSAEATRPLKCSRCGVEGHNKKTCKAVMNILFILCLELIVQGIFNKYMHCNFC